ncbi:MAG: glycoside hydrolase family 16 protein [Planctomycetota bacterium]|jgi:beta-glucanase (GH16 family)
MKLQYIAALTFLLTMATLTPSAEALPVEGYELVWSDEFDGEALDFDKWDYRGLGPRRDAVSVKETVSLDGDGHLVLTTTRAGDKYHTAMIGTQGKYEPTFGYFECRVKLQTQIGHWSAFWLQSPTLGNPVGDPAKAGTEIDVFEYLRNRGEKIQHTLHWDGYGEHHKSATKIPEIPGLTEGWHTIGFLWTPTHYVFYIDGRETWRTDKGVSRRPQYMILSLEVGKWAGDIAEAELPDSLHVDYVTVYKKTRQAASQEQTVRDKHKKAIDSEFIVGAFPGPPNGQINPARYREIAEAGIDVIVPFWGTMDGAVNPDMLDLAHAAGVRVLAMDKRIGPITMTADSEYDPSIVESIASDYKAHPALFGYGVRDEPPVELFDRISAICDLFMKLDPEHPPLMDLFPGYARPQQLGVEDYRDYVQRFVEQVDPIVLMYNHYPLRVNRKADTGWHRDLALFRAESRRAGIAFWVFAQCQGIRGYLRVPTREEIAWQANTALAYGARGIWWYRYWTAPPENEAQRQQPPRHPGSMIDRHGKRSPSYYNVQQTNRFLRKAGPALIGWDNLHVARIRNGQIEAAGECPAASITGDDFNLVVGTFTRNKAIHLVLANDSYEHPAVFSITPAKNRRIRKVIASRNAQLPADMNSAAVVWSLGPAGCVLIELTH